MARKKTPTKNAEAQTRYRAKHLGTEGEGARINMVVSHEAKAALEKLAAEWDVPQRLVIERLLLKVGGG